MKMMMFAVMMILVSCGTQKTTTSDVADVSVENLWAGNVTALLTRSPSNPPCGGGSPVGNSPISFSTWTRQRATDTNVCFEVWKPGVTDQENPDFARILDVQVHFRYKEGNFKSSFVNAHDRVGNNRRYAWDIRGLDPWYGCGSCQPPSDIPVIDEGAYKRVTMEFYFTVNGNELKQSDGKLFSVKFMNY